MTDSARPFFVIYVVWHPSFVDGLDVAQKIREHFGRKLYENIAGGAGLSVVFRFAPTPGADAPLPIDLMEAETTAVVVLAEKCLTSDPAWLSYVNDLATCTEEAGLATRLFPVVIDEHALDIGVQEQAFRWDKWGFDKESRCQRLITELTYEFCRMLRHHLEYLSNPKENDETLDSYLKKVRIFLSHSKHDDYGEKIAHRIRDRLYAGHGLASFFDVHDIPAGLRFNKVLLQQVRVSAVVAIHTDSYSSREWCRREIIEAKRWNVPLVVANCLKSIDERGFPYMGNVPMVRMEPEGSDRIDFIIGRLLDEVLKDFLWRCRVKLSLGDCATDTVFLPRPPELISLAGLPEAAASKHTLIVYPDPPLSAEEERLFETVAPRIRLRSLTEWLAETSR